jgi:hypothetical protein
VYFAGLCNAIGENRALTVNEDHHVMAETTLIVHHIAAKPGIVAEHGLEHVPYGISSHFGSGGVDVALQVGGENDPWHDALVLPKDGAGGNSRFPADEPRGDPG